MDPLVNILIFEVIDAHIDPELHTTINPFLWIATSLARREFVPRIMGSSERVAYSGGCEAISVEKKQWYFSGIWSTRKLRNVQLLELQSTVNDEQTVCDNSLIIPIIVICDGS